jgi:hypothetical protein
MQKYNPLLDYVVHTLHYQLHVPKHYIQSQSRLLVHTVSNPLSDMLL